MQQGRKCDIDKVLSLYKSQIYIQWRDYTSLHTFNILDNIYIVTRTANELPLNVQLIESITNSVGILSYENIMKLDKRYSAYRGLQIDKCFNSN